MSESFKSISDYGAYIILMGIIGLWYGVGISLTIFAALLFKPLVHLMYTLDSIRQGSIQVRPPTWLNECLDGASQVFKEVPSNKVVYAEGMLAGMSALIWAYIAMVCLGLIIFSIAMMSVLMRENNDNQNRGYRLLA